MYFYNKEVNPTKKTGKNYNFPVILSIDVFTIVDGVPFLAFYVTGAKIMAILYVLKIKHLKLFLADTSLENLDKVTVPDWFNKKAQPSG